MLRQEQAAAGRLWLLLRYFDQSGSGVDSHSQYKRNIHSSQSAIAILWLAAAA
ncbi:MAG: hypothetical protein M5U34_16870 [Chloroflexi bacterium]|nr:hypothetical protein [Chloroflexota bacterium]